MGARQLGHWRHHWQKVLWLMNPTKQYWQKNRTGSSLKWWLKSFHRIRFFFFLKQLKNIFIFKISTAKPCLNISDVIIRKDIYIYIYIYKRTKQHLQMCCCSEGRLSHSAWSWTWWHDPVGFCTPPPRLIGRRREYFKKQPEAPVKIAVIHIKIRWGAWPRPVKAKVMFLWQWTFSGKKTDMKHKVDNISLEAWIPF